jgi:hypothetical protein
MFAVIAAVLIFLAAVGVSADAVNLFYLGLAFLALHFAVDFAPWRRG